MFTHGKSFQHMYVPCTLFAWKSEQQVPVRQAPIRLYLVTLHFVSDGLYRLATVSARSASTAYPQTYKLPQTPFHIQTHACIHTHAYILTRPHTYTKHTRTHAHARTHVPTHPPTRIHNRTKTWTFAHTDALAFSECAFSSYKLYAIIFKFTTEPTCIPHGETRVLIILCARPGVIPVHVPFPLTSRPRSVDSHRELS